MRSALVSRILSCLLVAAASAGCGYALAGRGNALPAHIQTIGVPDIVNQSIKSEIDQVLTEAVRAEFQSRGRYSVHPEGAGVDAVFRATITSVTRQPLTLTESRQASTSAIIVMASVEFRDLIDNKVLWSNPVFRIQDEYQETPATQVADPVSIILQDANTLERLSRRFAREVVSSILEAF
jgi:outer membrane lipopolysaccharide assembly protein LptE/RlpB